MRDLVAALEDAHQGAERVLQLAKEIRKLASASGTADKKVLDLPDVLDMAVKLIEPRARSGHLGQTEGTR